MRATDRHLALWTLQGWIAMFFLAACYAKLTEPVDILPLMLGWPEMADEVFVRGVGALEIGLAAGVLAPLLS